MLEIVSNWVRQFRIMFGNAKQLLLVVPNQPAALSASQCDLKRAATGIVFFVIKDVTSPHIFFVAPFDNRRRENVKTFWRALFSAICLHDRERLVDHEVRTGHEITN